MKTLKDKLKRVYRANDCCDVTDIDGATNEVRELAKTYSWTPALRMRLNSLSKQKLKLQK